MKVELYDEWLKTQTFKKYDTSFVQDTVNAELTRFRNMPTEEYILWQKWEEVNDMYPMQRSGLFDEWAYTNSKHAALITSLRTKLWDGDYKDVEPELIYVADGMYKSLQDHWTALRVLIHTQQHSGSIGRTLNYLVRDKKTQKYLGVISIASDFLDITCRDAYVCWTRAQRTKEQRIQHTAVCSTIVPVQPFGYNFVGGKLLALLCLSDVVQNQWQTSYKSKLVGLTTTSLYGKNKGGHGMSQYDRLKYWKKMGYSKGSSPYRMSVETKKIVYDWSKEHYPEDYFRHNVATDEYGDPLLRDRQNRFQQRMYRNLKISGDDYKSNHDRGVYFAELYTNTKEFLRDEIKEKELVSVGEYSVASLTDLWKSKYAEKRFKSLQQTNRVSRTSLYYSNMSEMTWEEAKTYYLPDVGR